MEDEIENDVIDREEEVGGETDYGRGGGEIGTTGLVIIFVFMIGFFLIGLCVITAYCAKMR